MAAPVVAPLPPVTGGRNQDLGPLLTFVASPAGTTNSGRVPSVDAAGLAVVIDVTAITGSITVTIEGYDIASGKAFPVLVSTAIAAPGTTVLKVNLGAVVVANLVANDHVPAWFDVKAVIATGPATATISAHLLR